MLCIFCKQPSDDSHSVEHILPESLGNTSQVLPHGVVCDKCNNYFSRKVEKPFLEASGILNLRSFQFIPSKKGIIPPTTGYLDGQAVKVFPHEEGSTKASIAVESRQFSQIKKSGEAVLKLYTGSLPTNPVPVSRLLAKVAIEALAQRLLDIPGGLDYVEDSQFDGIRNHARIGQPPQWTFHSRHIYGSNERRINSKGETYQIVYEYNLFWTPTKELYFVLILFGEELVINLGGPDVDGYVNWLEDNNGISPLYTGKNADLI